MVLKHKRWARWASFFVVCLISLVVVHGNGFAQSFGNGTYGSCSYGGACPQGSTSTTSNAEDPQTTMQLPSGLAIAVNLYDGQRIPEAGYTIIVTPLNGRGISFKTVAFYINGPLAQTVQPAADGTASWLWHPRQYPGTQIVITVTGQDGETATKQFNITLTDQAIGNSSLVATALSSAATHSTIARIFSKLPRPIVYSFPYLLFILLALTMLSSLVQTYREMAEARRLHTQLARIRQLRETKQTFVNLASHYLRTPITLLSGGLEMLGTNTPELHAIQSLIQRLQTHVDGLIQEQAQQTEMATNEAGTIQHIYRRVGFWIPIVLTGSLAFAFDYLAVHIDSISFTDTNLYTQIALFVLIASLSYVILRMLQLKRSDTTRLRHILLAETSLMHTREQFLSDSLAALDTDTHDLSTRIQELRTAQGGTFIRDGLQRLQAALTKFSVADRLKGSASPNPFVHSTLAGIMGRMPPQLGRRATAKAITIDSSQDLAFACQDVNLLALVLSHVLDNAIAYAPEKSTITLTVTATSQYAVITVTDYGPGIARDKLDLLFKPFSKTEGAQTFNHEGMGFSLYLDKLILTYLSGAITISSEPDVATTVRITLVGLK
jgi:signal transduction histidine kinase